MTTTEQAVKKPTDTVGLIASKNVFDRLGEWTHCLGVATSYSFDPVQSSATRAFCQAPAIYAMAPQSALEKQIARLSVMREAGDGWAGPGSVAPNEASLDAAVTILNRMKHLPFPVPMASIGSHGNAGLFWSDDHLYADVELLEDGKVGYLLHPANGEEVDNEEDMPSVGLPAAIAKALTAAYLSNRR